MVDNNVQSIKSLDSIEFNGIKANSLPHSIEAEEALLGSILLDNEIYNKIIFDLFSLVKNGKKYANQCSYRHVTRSISLNVLATMKTCVKLQIIISESCDVTFQVTFVTIIMQWGFNMK